MPNSGRKWGEWLMLMGEFHHNIDDKGRLIIPSKFRDEIGHTFVVTRGLENCLFVYPNNEWQQIVTKLKSLPFTKKDARSFNRFFLSGATDCVFDKQGRINIPSVLSDFAGLEKECVIIGVNDRLEIWSKTNWEQFLNSNEESLSDIADNLFTVDINV